MTLVDVLKCQILGEVEYAQHNFARLRPLLYSTDGRCWTGIVEKAWFPQAGLVFSLAAELRFAQSGSLWTFQVRPNERQSGSEDGKDAFMTIQVKPATRFLTEIEPLPSEDLRRLATIDGFDPRAAQGGVLFSEADNRWILASEFERGPDGRARVTNDRALRHMRVLEGTLEEIAGCPTSDGRWILPVIHSGHGSDVRNWRAPGALAEQVASDLKRWLPHAPHKARAAAAASALRDLAPALETVSALRSVEVRAALDRVIALAENAETLTDLTEQLVEALLTSPAIAAAMEVEKAAMRRDLDSQALESAERLEADVRASLTAEQADMREALERDGSTLEAMRAEISTTEAALEDMRRRHRTETSTFTRSLEALIARARKEPAAYAAEWLGKLGLNEVAGINAASTAIGGAPQSMHVDTYETIAEAELGRALIAAAPIRNEGLPRYLVMDAAIRARELVVCLGPRARDVIETWLATFAPLWTVARVADPSLLAFDDLLPTGPRGAAAPLANAIARATAAPERAVVALLDDVDSVAGAFWLPQAARAARQPDAHGLPANLFLVALMEGEPATMGLSLERVGELFPLAFDDVTAAPGNDARPKAREIPLSLFAPPLAMNGVRNRVAALINSASHAFSPEDISQIGEQFAAYLDWTKLGGEKPSETMEIASALASAAGKTRKAED